MQTLGGQKIKWAKPEFRDLSGKAEPFLKADRDVYLAEPQREGPWNPEVERWEVCAANGIKGENQTVSN